MEEYDLYVLARAIQRILGSIFPYFFMLLVAVAAILLVRFFFRKKEKNTPCSTEQYAELEQRVARLEQIISDSGKRTGIQ